MWTMWRGAASSPGMMLIGAVTAFHLAFAGYPLVVAAGGGVLAGAASSLVFGVLALNVLANQYAAGIALTILGGGLSAFLGREFGAAPIEPVEALHIPVLSEIPVIGRILFDYDPQGIGPASEFLSALPYVATILVLVLISRNRQTQKMNFPASLAKPFRPGH